MKLEFETNKPTVPFADEDFVSEVNSENGSHETMQMLRAGIRAAQAGNRAEARQMLLRVTDAEPNNENAWLWLASISEYPEELLIFLDNVLNINPVNQRALEWVKATKSLLSKTFVQRGIDASKETHTDFAKQCFLQALVHDTQNEMAWLWLASVSDSVEEKSGHLQKVLNINPENETAKTLLQSARRQMVETQMQKAIAAAAADDRETSNRIVLDILRQSPDFEDAWVLKSYLSASFNDKIVCFKKILDINSDNALAQVSLISLLGMMGKAESKPQAEETAPVSAVEPVKSEENFTDLTVPEAVEPENYFTQPLAEPENYFSRTVSDEEVLEEINKLVEVTPETNSYQFTENDEQIDVPMEELDFSEKPVEEANYFETADVPNNDVPELEFDAAESSEPIEFEGFDDELSETAKVSEAVSESEVVESFTGFQNNNDETDVKVESGSDNQTESTVETFGENPVSEYVEHFLPDYSVAEPENFSTDTENHNEQAAVQPVVEEEFSLFNENTEPAENVEVLQSNESAPSYLEVEDEIFTPHAAAENDFIEPSADFIEPSIESENPAPAQTFEETAPPETFVDFTSPVEEKNQFEAAESDTFEEIVFSHPEAVEKNIFEQLIAEESAEEHEAESSLSSETEQLAGPFNVETGDRPEVEMAACPFCNSENESTAVVCNSCRAILTLSDMEMLLAHQEVDTEMLTNAVERMEVEKTLRDFSSEELKFLGIGQINLKHLRQGHSYLQAASKLNPNDIVLNSQVNALAIRLSEIEQQESAHNSMPKNRTILVVDDSATVRKLVSGKLEKCGHEVICAIDGVDALDKINALVPDLILLDITMPRMDGYQVCKLIRNNEATKDVPIVMISGKDGFFDKVRGRMAGTTGYITKPFGPETLMKTVEAYIV